MTDSCKDLKIVTGNSLIGFPFKSQRLDTIEQLKQKFFEETDHDRRTDFKNQIDEQLHAAFAASEKSLGYRVDFDFEITFSEIFRTNKGFDIVIANPPYVRQEAIKDIKPRLKQRSDRHYSRGIDADIRSL